PARQTTCPELRHHFKSHLTGLISDHHQPFSTSFTSFYPSSLPHHKQPPPATVQVQASA
ncbi:hypothetical protein TYRP_021609, partial [Tyrophagus putrescentiae]